MEVIRRRGSIVPTADGHSSILVNVGILLIYEYNLKKAGAHHSSRASRRVKRKGGGSPWV
jgi:hypothetical protein